MVRAEHKVPWKRFGPFGGFVLNVLSTYIWQEIIQTAFSRQAYKPGLSGRVETQLFGNRTLMALSHKRLNKPKSGTNYNSALMMFGSKQARMYRKWPENTGNMENYMKNVCNLCIWRREGWKHAVVCGLSWSKLM